jgi:hypothetical protein
MAGAAARRLRRLAEELEESGLALDGDAAFRELLVHEIDHALRPAVHERRVASNGTILEPLSDPSTWASGAQLDFTRGPVDQPLADARRFADGLSSWLLRASDGTSEWMVLDRPAGSERDLVVLAGVLDATIVQRHPPGRASRPPPARARSGRWRRDLRRRRRAPSDRRAAGAEQEGRTGGRRLRRNPAHVGAPLQLRRSAGDRDRGERGRSGFRVRNGAVLGRSYTDE